MDSITFSDLTHLALVVMAIWGFIKIVNEIVEALKIKFKKEESVNTMEDRLIRNIQEERDKIYRNYDPRLDEIQKEIENNHTETEAKLQELVSMVMILTKGQVAALDGLKQQGCNGQVTQAKKELDDFLMSKAVDL